MEARDPYCAYDISVKSCVTLLRNTNDSGVKLQDVVNGDSTGCEGEEYLCARVKQCIQ